MAFLYLVGSHLLLMSPSQQVELLSQLGVQSSQLLGMFCRLLHRHVELLYFCFYLTPGATLIMEDTSPYFASGGKSL